MDELHNQLLNYVGQYISGQYMMKNLVRDDLVELLIVVSHRRCLVP